MGPEVFIACLGLFSTVAGFLAGRAKVQIKAYKDLVADLRAEIDRLHTQVKQLQAAVRRLTTRQRTHRIARNIHRSVPAG